MYCGSSKETSLSANKDLNQYDDSMLDNLCSRFEEVFSLSTIFY